MISRIYGYPDNCYLKSKMKTISIVILVAMICTSHAVPIRRRIWDGFKWTYEKAKNLPLTSATMITYHSWVLTNNMQTEFKLPPPFDKLNTLFDGLQESIEVLKTKSKKEKTRRKELDYKFNECIGLATAALFTGIIAAVCQIFFKIKEERKLKESKNPTISIISRLDANEGNITSAP